MDLRTEVRDWPVERAAVAVIGRSGLLDRLEVGGGGEFQWASVTKLLTALTVLDACADGPIELEQPAGPAGSTVAHLLAHASGLPFDRDTPVAPPGVRRTYSNSGYELVAAHLASLTGGSFVDELIGRVLRPLGMASVTSGGSPARGAAGPIDDLIRLADELLNPVVLRPEIIRQASTLAFPGLTGILPGFGRQTPNDWGLGCEIRSTKRPHWTSPDNDPATFGHFGQSGSFLWVDPVANVACVGLSDADFGPWATVAWPRLSTAVLENFRA